MILEKILELIRTENNIPCQKFVLNSTGLIQTLTPNKLGAYTLVNNFLIDNRFVYERQTPTEHLLLTSRWNHDYGGYFDWAVRYRMDSW